MKDLKQKGLSIFFGVIIIVTLITTFYLTFGKPYEEDFAKVEIHTNNNEKIIEDQLGEPKEEEFVEIEIHTNNNEKIIEDNGSWIEYSENWDQEVLVTTNITEKTLTFTDGYRMKMMSKGLHPLNIQHKYLHDRIDRIEKFCSDSLLQSKGVYNFGGGYHRVRFSDKSELLQCAVLKVSSRTWIRVFRELEGIKEEPKPYVNTINRISLSINYQKPKLNARRYQTYTKFLIARNPFQRLLSAYKEIFITHNGLGKQTFNEIIIINYLSNFTEESITQMRNELKRRKKKLTQSVDDSIIQQIRRMNVEYGKSQITFLEFLNFVVYTFRNKGIESLDDHWKPISYFCDLCAIKYDIIAKFETLKEDSDAILNYVQRNNPNHNVTFPDDDPYTTFDRCNEAFKIVPLHVRRSLYELFKEDYLLFDYEYRGDDEYNIC